MILITGPEFEVDYLAIIVWRRDDFAIVYISVKSPSGIINTKIRNKPTFIGMKKQQLMFFKGEGL